MKTFKVHWYYAHKDPTGQQPITEKYPDLGYSGGEVEYQAESADDAVQQFKDHISSAQWVQPYDESLLRVSVREMVEPELLRAALEEAVAALERVQPQAKGVLVAQDVQAAIAKGRALLGDK